MDLKSISLKNKSYLKLWAVARRYRKFPQYSVWSELFDRLPTAIISFMIIKYFGQDMLGYYSISLMVISLPSTLISGSIGEAFGPRLAMAKHENKHVELLKKLYIRLVAIMIFPFIILGLFSDRLFPIVFGVDWVQAGIISQILVFRIFFEIVFSPSMSLVNIMEKQELNIIRAVVSTVISVSALGLGAYYDNFYLALWCLALFEGASIAILGGYMMRLIHFPFLYAIKKLARFILIAVFLGGTIFVTEDLFFANNLYLIAIISMAFLFYYATLVYLDRELLISLKIFSS
jgi:O-antigen/teichoic acid export membrane protein